MNKIKNTRNRFGYKKGIKKILKMKKKMKYKSKQNQKNYQYGIKLYKEKELFQKKLKQDRYNNKSLK